MAGRGAVSQSGQGWFPQPWWLIARLRYCRPFTDLSPRSSALSHSLLQVILLATFPTAQLASPVVAAAAVMTESAVVAIGTVMVDTLSMRGRERGAESEIGESAGGRVWRELPTP